MDMRQSVPDNSRIMNMTLQDVRLGHTLYAPSAAPLRTDNSNVDVVGEVNGVDVSSFHHHTILTTSSRDTVMQADKCKHTLIVDYRQALAVLRYMPLFAGRLLIVTTEAVCQV